jgi:hypothetical protein
MVTETAMRSGRWMQTKTQTASHHPRLPHDQRRPYSSHHHQACQQTYSHRTSPPRSSRPQPAPRHPTPLRSRPRQTRAPRPVADHSVARHSPVTLLPTGLRTAKPTVKHQTPRTNPAPHPASPTNHQQRQRAHLTTARGAQRPVTTPTPPQPCRQRFDSQAQGDSRRDSPSPRTLPRSGSRRPRCRNVRLRARRISITKNEGFPSLAPCTAH